MYVCGSLYLSESCLLNRDDAFVLMLWLFACLYLLSLALSGNKLLYGGVDPIANNLFNGDDDRDVRDSTSFKSDNLDADDFVASNIEYTIL